MNISVTPSGQACGAIVGDVDLSQKLSADTIESIRAAWLQHHVLVFPEQAISDDDLERFTAYFGDFGDDPFIKPIEGRERVIAVQRNADETSSIFAEAWHSDWSFQANPPAGTCLYGITIPPVGGDTLFANQHKALAEMPAELREKIAGKLAIHSAAGGYAPSGLYGEADNQSDRSMRIQPSETAYETFQHPIIRQHPETGREGLFSCMGYIMGVEGLSQDEALQLLTELYAWQTSEQFQYCHKWHANMLVMWDNRSVLHRATGGYEGYDRLLHRTTIGSAQS